MKKNLKKGRKVKLKENYKINKYFYKNFINLWKDTI